MGKKRQPYFRPEDFAAFRMELAESQSPTVIAERKRVVEERMKPLHQGFSGEQGLGEFVRGHGLEAHWSPGHLTNVYWPFAEANAGWVDYIRMGYGKPELLVKDLARRSGVDRILTNSGSYDTMAFHHVTQIQVGLDQSSWWIDWYQDRKAWLEQNNWLAKIKDKQRRNRMIGLLADLQHAGHEFKTFQQDEGVVEYSGGEEFLDAVSRFRREGVDVSLIVGLTLEPDDIRNDERLVLPFVRQEFERLKPLYEFTSWHPKLNNYIAQLSG